MRFKFGDIVQVKSGFYRGQIAEVTDFFQPSTYHVILLGEGAAFDMSSFNRNKRFEERALMLEPQKKPKRGRRG